MKPKLNWSLRLLYFLRVVGETPRGSRYLILWNPLSWVLLFFGGLYIGAVAAVAMYSETVTDSLNLGRYGDEKN